MKRSNVTAAVAIALLFTMNVASSQELAELIRKGKMRIIDANGTPSRVELVGDKLILELPPPPPPRIEIPIRQVQCQGGDISNYFFLKCYSGKCMVTTKDSMKFEGEIHVVEMPDKLAAAAAAACVKVQNALGGVITK